MQEKDLSKKKEIQKKEGKMRFLSIFKGSYKNELEDGSHWMSERFVKTKHWKR
jgi:hypothetical protein